MITFVIVLTAAGIGSLASTGATEVGADPTTSVLTQLGVFAACFVIGWFMLRRSDKRDEVQDRIREAASDKLLAAKDETIQHLLVELGELKRRVAQLEGNTD